MMEAADDEIPMLRRSEKKPTKMTPKMRVMENGLTHDDIFMVQHKTEPIRMSTKLTLLTVLLLLSTFVFLVLFLMVPLFYNLNHPINPDNGTAGELGEGFHDMRGHSHGSSGGGVGGGGGGGTSEGGDSMAEGMHADLTATNLEGSGDMMDLDSELAKDVLSLCPCFDKFTGKNKEQRSKKDLEDCLRSCFADKVTQADEPAETTVGKV